MKKKYNIIILFLVILAYGWGIISQKRGLFPVEHIKYVKHSLFKALLLEKPIKDDFDIENKVEIDIKSLQGNVVTILVFGQSNAANFGETKKITQHNVYNLYYVTNKLYSASDPLLGANGDKGSVWTRLGDKLIEQGFYSNVVFIPIAVGSSDIQRWDVGGDLHARILKAIQSAKVCGLTIDKMLWYQGESDAGIKTTKENYKKMFMSMLKSIRNQGVQAPIYLAIATDKREPHGKEIYEAQIELINNKDVFLGPKVFDEIRSLDDRYQFVHYSDSGLDLLADLWLKSIGDEP